ncbi:MAG: putative peptidoglycan glycosyltransferase FtsW [Eubacteriales bacterium]|nr:putative peptidoglycan glycosyltransferase FtsW [Eubacteriales bacterium]
MAMRVKTAKHGTAKSGKRIAKKTTEQVFRYYDYNLLASVILLTCFGLVMLYSTSAYSAQVTFNNDMYYFTKQAFISGGCLILVLIFSQIDYHFYARFAGILYVVSNILLFLTKFIGTELNGAKRWIYLGPVSFQPAEMAKLSIILFLPVLIVKIGKNMKTWGAFWTVLISGGLTSFLALAFTDNLSTAIILAGITVGLLFIVFPKNKPFLIGAGIVAVVAAAVIYYAKTAVGSDNFRLRRVIVWLNPEANASLGGYQVMQGLYAIGSGGFFGKGLGNSLQKLDYVPEAQNDMIFTIICEELGLFGAIMLCLLFAFMLYRLLFIAQNAPDLLGSLIASGIFVHISLQVVLNIAVVTGAIPTTGVTLPFVSYGGTSIMFLMAEMTLALSVSRQIKFKEESDK